MQLAPESRPRPRSLVEPTPRARIIANNRSHFSLAVHFLPVRPAPRGEHELTLIVDFPTGFALKELEALPVPERRHTLVLTAGETAAYEDALGSYRVSGITSLSGTRVEWQRKLSAAANGERTFRQYTRLTFQQLRVLRRLLAGTSVEHISEELRITAKTLNSHVSGMLAMFDAPTRTALVARVLHGAERG